MTTTPKYHLTPDALAVESQQIISAQADNRAFEPLYNAYYERILHFVYLRVESKELAYDITAQTFCNALENIKKYISKGVPFSAWLFRIALNELNKFYRTSKSRPVVSIESDLLPVLYEDLQEERQDEKDKRLGDAIQTLDEAEIQMVQMRFFDGIAFKEIAEVMELSESAAKMKLYRALEKLKKKL